MDKVFPQKFHGYLFLKEPNTTSHGIYPVYLYYKENNILILAYGISETTAPANNWEDIKSKQTINEYFATNFSKNQIDTGVHISTKYMM